MSVLLNPGQGGVESFVLHLYPSPGLEPERLPGRQRDLAQHLEAKVMVHESRGGVDSLRHPVLHPQPRDPAELAFVPGDDGQVGRVRMCRNQ